MLYVGLRFVDLHPCRSRLAVRNAYAECIFVCSEYLDVASTSRARCPCRLCSFRSFACVRSRGTLGRSTLLDFACLSYFISVHVLAQKRVWFGRHLSTLPILHRHLLVRRSLLSGHFFFNCSHHGFSHECLPLVRRRLRRRPRPSCGGRGSARK